MRALRREDAEPLAAAAGWAMVTWENVNPGSDAGHVKPYPATNRAVWPALKLARLSN
jgi:hypothetical protein